MKACIVLFPLLGITWLFGLLSIAQAGVVPQYIFTVLNSVQVRLQICSIVQQDCEHVVDVFSSDFRSYKRAEMYESCKLTQKIGVKKRLFIV